MNSTRFDRREFKFVIDAEQRRQVLLAVAARMTPDPHGDAEGCYPIISVYYDNDSLDLLLASIRGVSSRRKLRLRLYGDASTRSGTACFMEIKHRYRARVAKRRVALGREEALALGRGQRPSRPLSEIDRMVVDEVLGMVGDLGLKPSCVMRYARQAFRGQPAEPDLRLTFDSQIWVRDHDFEPHAGDRDFDHSLLPPDRAILEIKVAERVPYWLAHLVGRTGCVRQPFSKYNHALRDLDLRPALGSAESPRSATATPIAHIDSLETPWIR